MYTTLCYTISGTIISFTLLLSSVNPEMGNLRTDLFLQMLCKYTCGFTLKFQFWGNHKNNIVLWIFIVQRGQKEAYAEWSLIRCRKKRCVQKPPKQFHLLYWQNCFPATRKELKIESIHSLHTHWIFLTSLQYSNEECDKHFLFLFLTSGLLVRKACNTQ